ncbi:MAG: hypothetical protein ACHQT6_05840 [Candidatus Acidiferrales bacterium]
MGTVVVSRVRPKNWRLCGYVLGFCVLGVAPFSLRAGQGTPAAPAPKSPPALGTIKTISGNTLTLTTDAGAEIKVVVSQDAKLLRVPPGSKDLKEAAPLQFADLQAGDRILVRGKPGDDPNSMVASSVVAMKKTDIAEKQAHEREEWQRHGIGGLVRSVDAFSGVITIGTTTATGNKDVAIHTAPTTILRRYAPGSVKFDDAKPSTLVEIKTGDQLRARGTRNADGSEFTAEEIVSGAFRNIAGMIVSIDAGGGSFTVNDLGTKKNVEVKLLADSQLRKLPKPMAQRIAMQLKGAPADAAGSGDAAKPGTAPSAPSTAPAPQGQPGTGAGARGGSGGGMNGVGRAGGGDLQQMLSRLPANSLADFQKGDAVMIVATADHDASKTTAITVLGGVEPILQASPQGQAASILTPWSLNNGGDAAAAGTP